MNYKFVCKRGNTVVAVFDSFQEAVKFMKFQHNLDLPESSEEWTFLPIRSILKVEKILYNPSSHEYPSRNHN